MADVFSRAKRSEVMRAVRSKGTALEERARRLIEAALGKRALLAGC
jgi:G:T-mismatch repair DNA endonuclease (very short patch repair protein)